MAKTIYALCVVTLLMIVAPSVIMAQNPQVLSTSPSANSTGVALSTQIDIRFNLRVAQNKVFSEVPLIDTVPPNDRKPCIFVMPKMYYDTLVEYPELLKRMAFRGTISLPNDTTVRLTLNAEQLRPGCEYAVFVSDVRVMRIKSDSSGFDTLTVGNSAYTFTTEMPPYRIVMSSLWNKDVIRRSDTIRFRFNRPLMGTSVSSGPLAVVQKVIGRSQRSDGFVDNYAGVQASIWLEEEGRVLAVKPIALFKDTTYRVLVNVGYLTGSNDDNVSALFTV